MTLSKLGQSVVRAIQHPNGVETECLNCGCDIINAECCDHCEETAPTVELLGWVGRQFGGDDSFKGTRVLMTQEEFMTQVRDAIRYSDLFDGNAPFVKHLWMSNFSDTRCAYMPREKGMNIQVGYITRKDMDNENPKEIPFKAEWVEGVKAPVASWFDIILYTKEQLAKEGIEIEADYGIVSINTELTYGQSSPIATNTQIRNALGIEFGGNGEPLNRERYLEAVEFEKKHIQVGKG